MKAFLRALIRGVGSIVAGFWGSFPVASAVVYFMYIK